MQHCLQAMMHRATATGQEISALEAVTIDAVSLEVSEHLQDPSTDSPSFASL